MCVCVWGGVILQRCVWDSVCWSVSVCGSDLVGVGVCFSLLVCVFENEVTVLSVKVILQGCVSV